MAVGKSFMAGTMAPIGLERCSPVISRNRCAVVVAFTVVVTIGVTLK